MNKFLQEKIDKLENENNVKVIYVTQTGSTLYGVNTPTSDIDYAGIFVPAFEDVLLKKDKMYFKEDTNKSNTKNTSDDIDCMFHSIYKFMDEIEVGETGAIDMLFSMFREDTIEFSTPESRSIRDNYKYLISKKIQKFVGYCVSQSSQYGLKGARWKELNELMESDIIKELIHDADADKQNETVTKIQTKWDDLLKFAKGKKYITEKVIDGNTYLQVLNRNFQNTITAQKFVSSVKKLMGKYGERSKSSAEGTDWKALSHSSRIILEAEELLKTGFITFPIPNSQFVLDIKQQNVKVEEVTEWLSSKIDEVNLLVETSELPDTISKDTKHTILLNLVKG